MGRSDGRCNLDDSCDGGCLLGAGRILDYPAQFQCDGRRYAGVVLMQATDGNLYGTTLYGEAYYPPAGCGTIFKIDLAGTETTLDSFNNAQFDAEPNPLMQAGDGSFYITTYMDGTFGYGTGLKLTPSGPRYGAVRLLFASQLR